MCCNAFLMHQADIPHNIIRCSHDLCHTSLLCNHGNHYACPDFLVFFSLQVGPAHYMVIWCIFRRSTLFLGRLYVFHISYFSDIACTPCHELEVASLARPCISPRHLPAPASAFSETTLLTILIILAILMMNLHCFDRRRTQSNQSLV